MLCIALLPRGKVRKLDFKSEFSMSKIIRIFLIFFSLKKNWLGAHFLLRDHPFKTSACSRGEGVKNLPNLPTDSSKKLPTVGG